MATDEGKMDVKQVFDDGKDWIHNYMMEYDDEQYNKDCMYMYSLYPEMSREILGYVKAICDREEYEGSPMFDEYPDKLRVQKMVDDIYGMAAYLENMYRPIMEEDEEIHAQEHCVSCRGQDNWLKNLVTALLINEMHQRRRRYFKRKKGTRAACR